jgi:hypothetical protein
VRACFAVAQESLRCFLLLILTIGLAASLLRIHAEGGTPANDAGSGAFQPLDLKPGCWQLRVNTSQTGILEHVSAETYRKSMPNATDAQIAKIVAQVNAQVDKQEEASRKGTNRSETRCPLKKDFEAEIIGQVNHRLGSENCTRTFHSTGQELHLHVTCPTRDGAPGAEQTTDFERIDPESFKGSIHVVTRAGKTVTETMTFTGTWISDASPHLPSVTTDQNGAKPKGPGAVAKLDPLRVVAIIDGKQMTARQATELMNGHRSNGSGLTEFLQKLYLRRAIADEAVELHLDRQPPWKEKLQDAQRQIFQVHQNYAGDPNIPPELMAQWEAARVQILWDAYFNRAGTEEEKQLLLKREADKCKLKVVDPDFFDGH